MKLKPPKDQWAIHKDKFGTYWICHRCRNLEVEKRECCGDCGQEDLTKVIAKKERIDKGTKGYIKPVGTVSVRYILNTGESSEWVDIKYADGD